MGYSRNGLVARCVARPASERSQKWEEVECLHLCRDDHLAATGVNLPRDPGSNFRYLILEMDKICAIIVEVDRFPKAPVAAKAVS